MLICAWVLNFEHEVFFSVEVTFQQSMKPGQHRRTAYLSVVDSLSVFEQIYNFDKPFPVVIY